ncbi:hypothetical protein Ahy_A05g022363 [Arachis hypogaea]|uniref:Uncharacterized protein n=1 Tax=Arachis hypogaea TaxID=3818 RepID=A0A445D0J7_ARAHY|nr:hypothetical protein Ahy_A05g022363 [Arachis hypogaea]
MEVISNQVMGTFNLSVYYGGRFGYDNGTLEYIEGERTVIEDIDMDCWSVFEAYVEVGQFGYTKEKISGFWYKDPSSEWLEKDLKLIDGDRDAIEMCKIAGKRHHVGLYVVHKIEDAEEFPEVGFLDVGGQSEQGQEAQRGNDEEVHNEKKLVEVERDNVKKLDEGDKLNPEEQVKSNSDDNSDDEDFIPSADEVDSADDVMFTDSEEEYDDESGFDEVRGGTDGNRVDKGKGVAGGDFSDEEGFNSDEVDVDYEVGGGSEKEDNEDDDNHEASRYPIHRDVKDMTIYKWEVGTVYASREEFKDTVTAYAVQTRRGLRYAKLDLVRVRAVCQEGCPFWLYTAKMSEEETWQLRSMNLKHTCGQSHRVRILHTGWLSRAFRKKVEGNPKVKIKDLVNKAQRKWNLTVTTSMTARSRQAALDEIQGAYRKIADYFSELLRANPGSSVTLKGLLPAFDEVIPGVDHRFCVRYFYSNFKKKIFWTTVEFGHKRGGCKKPSLDGYIIIYSSTAFFNVFQAQQPSQAASKRTRGGRKPSSSRPMTSSKASSQPVMQSASGGMRRSTRSRSSSQPQPATKTSKPNSTKSRSKSTSSSTRPNSPPAGTLHRRPKRKPTRSITQQPPPPKEMGAASSNQPARTVSFSHRIPLHVSPRKLRLMAKFSPKLWKKL